MEYIMTTIEQLAGIHSQMNEIVRRVAGKSLDPEMVKRSLQAIIEKREVQGVHVATAHHAYSFDPPDWWRTPEQQLERARQLWPDAVLPEAPKEFTPQTKSEVLLLHKPGSFDALYYEVVAPIGHTKYRDDNVKSDKLNLRLAPGKVEYTEPVWLAFDPERGRGARPDSFWGRADTAASEIFSALIQFPEWSLSWFNGASVPALSGYQLKHDGSWSCVPCLDRWDRGRRLRLSAYSASYQYGASSSPSVRAV